MRRPRGALGSIAAKRRHRLPVFRSLAGPGRGPGTQTIRMPLGSMACQCKRLRSLALGYDGNHHVRMTIFFIFARASSDRGRSEALCGPKGPAYRNLIPFFPVSLGPKSRKIWFWFCSVSPALSPVEFPLRTEEGAGYGPWIVLVVKGASSSL